MRDDWRCKERRDEERRTETNKDKGRGEDERKEGEASVYMFTHRCPRGGSRMQDDSCWGPSPKASAQLASDVHLIVARFLPVPATRQNYLDFNNGARQLAWLETQHAEPVRGLRFGPAAYICRRFSFWLIYSLLQTPRGVNSRIFPEKKTPVDYHVREAACKPFLRRVYFRHRI